MNDWTPAVGSLVYATHLRIGGRVLADANQHRPAEPGTVWFREVLPVGAPRVGPPFVAEVAISKLRPAV